MTETWTKNTRAWKTEAACGPTGDCGVIGWDYGVYHLLISAQADSPVEAFMC